jgi:threonine synthase
MKWIDSRHSAQNEAVLRYFPQLLSEIIPAELLQRSSIREGFRLTELRPFQNVRLLVLDESSCMQTGTYKSLDGCITTSLCKHLGYKQIAFSSGANAGMALAEYGNRVGIETYFFCPSTTLYKIRGELFHNPLSHLICVEGTDRDVKRTARLFGELTGTPVVPLLEWRLLASSIRGKFLAEQMKSASQGYDWFAQSVCAGFGPIGTYRALWELSKAGELDSSWIPAFLGIQQSALSPIATAWKSGAASLSEPAEWNPGPSIEPGLYNTHPKETYGSLTDILSRTKGDMLIVEADEYSVNRQEYVDRLQEAGIRLTTQPQTGEYIERAGVLAGSGIIKAIKTGKIKEGQTVICSLSGGTGPLPASTPQPEWMIPQNENLESELSRYLAGRLAVG